MQEEINDRLRLPEIQIVLLSLDPDSKTLTAAFIGDASVCLFENIEDARLVRAINIGTGGSARFDDRIAFATLDFLRSRSRASSEPSDEYEKLKVLSRREREVLELLIQDKKTPEMAKELFVEVKTVKNHLSNIYKKLGVKNRSEAKALVAHWKGRSPSTQITG